MEAEGLDDEVRFVDEQLVGKYYDNLRDNEI